VETRCQGGGGWVRKRAMPTCMAVDQQTCGDELRRGQGGLDGPRGPGWRRWHTIRAARDSAVANHIRHDRRIQGLLDRGARGGVVALAPRSKEAVFSNDFRTRTRRVDHGGVEQPHTGRGEGQRTGGCSEGPEPACWKGRPCSQSSLREVRL
jgi:hypothetical protein